MKPFLCKVYCILLGFGVARAANALSREGKHEEAKQLLLMERDCKC
jgi:hypothetical protein